MDDDMLEFGVTLSVPAPWRRILALLRTSVGDPLGGQIDPHITLIPPTRIADADLLDVARHVDKVAAETPTFRIRLAGSGTFRPVTEVVFAPLVAGAPECTALAALLRSGPIEVPLERPYEPHVTVAHDIGKAGLDRASRYLNDFTATEILLSARAADNPTATWTPVHLAELGRTVNRRNHPPMSTQHEPPRIRPGQHLARFERFNRTMLLSAVTESGTILDLTAFDHDGDRPIAVFERTAEGLEQEWTLAAYLLGLDQGSAPRSGVLKAVQAAVAAIFEGADLDPELEIELPMFVAAAVSEAA